MIKIDTLLNAEQRMLEIEQMDKSQFTVKQHIKFIAEYDKLFKIVTRYSHILA